MISLLNNRYQEPGQLCPREPRRCNLRAWLSALPFIFGSSATGVIRKSWKHLTSSGGLEIESITDLSSIFGPRFHSLHSSLAWIAALFCTFSVFAGKPQFADVSAVLPWLTNNAATNVNGGSSAALESTNAIGVFTTNSMDTLDNKYLMAIGDSLSFRVLEDEDPAQKLVVTDSGDLAIPGMGRFAAVGKTCRQLAREIKTQLEKEYYYQATVILAVDQMTKSRGIVYVVGPVRAPGPQDLPSDEVLTLSKAILRAGGFTEYANKRKVKVTRKAANAGEADQTFIVDVGAILENGKTDDDIPLRAGDFIYVPERLLHF